MAPLRGLDLPRLTLQDALDLAVLIEEEARDRYEELAEQLLVHHTLEAAGFFQRMARIEERHRAQLWERRRENFGEAPSSVTRAMIFDVEAPEYDQARAFMGLREALETALAAEVKAHDFFAEALPSLTDQRIRSLFEELREEEIQHQALVRAELARCPEKTVNGAAYADDPVAQ